MLPWLSIAALAVVGCLGVVLAVWLIRSELRQRRQARYLAQLAAQYRKRPRALPAGEAGRKVTVDELVNRLEGEGLPVRLQWDEDEGGPDEDDWPTGVLPRVP